MRPISTGEAPNLFDLRQELLQCIDLSGCIRVALMVIQAAVPCQSAAVFRFAKDGLLRRIGIRATDVNGQPVPPSWFPEESYKPGAAFPGAAVPSCGGATYGIPTVFQGLDSANIDDSTLAEYGKTLGPIRNCIALPLNGRHRTFGFLQIINKCAALVGRDSDFTQADINRLTDITLCMATAMCSVHDDRVRRVISELIQRLAQPFDQDFKLSPVYRFAADTLAGDLFDYRACIIRVADRHGKLPVAAKAGIGISWDDRIDSSVASGERIAGRVFATGKKELVYDIRLRAAEFANIAWISRNQLCSIACLPIALSTKTIGTLSVYAGYPYVLYENGEDTLRTFAIILASMTETCNIFAALNRSQDARQRERDMVLRAARRTGYQVAEDMFHNLKNALPAIGTELKKLDSYPSAKRAQVLQKLDSQIRKMSETLHGDIQDVVFSSVNLVHVLKATTKFYAQELSFSNIHVVENLVPVPDVYASEEVLRDVFINMVSNAIKAIQHTERPWGEIRMTSEISEYRGRVAVQVSIADDGIGIPRESISQVFKRGFSTYIGGTGVGLFLARKIIDSLGGEIEIRSTVGKGSEFTITIPARTGQHE